MYVADGGLAMGRVVTTSLVPDLGFEAELVVIMIFSLSPFDLRIG